MSMRKRTLRKLLPVSRKYARLINELDSIARRAKNILSEIESIKSDSIALWNQNKYKEEEEKHDERDIF